MIKVVNKKVNELNHRLGIGFTIPNPSRRSLDISEASSLVIAGSCLTISLLTASKTLFALSVISAISAGVTHFEKKKF